MSLYQKYRPHKFEDVVGREFIITCLKNSIKNNNINHAYIFYGTRGTGKTTIARILAKAVNCLEEKLNNKPCGKCLNCKLFEDGKTPDIIEMDAASNRGIDDIRSIIDHSQYMPHHGKFKVYIIDEVHMLTKEAFNALLKTLEEPPKHIIFVLATTEINKVPETILSRCERYDFNKIRKEDIISRLEFIAKSEKIKIKKDALNLITDRAAGGMRDAIMLFEQFIDSNNTVTKEHITESLGLLSDTLLNSLINSIINSDFLEFQNILTNLNKQYLNISIVVEQINPILLSKMKENITNSDFKKYFNLLDTLDNIYKKIKYTSSPMLIFEALLLNELFNNSNIDIVNINNIKTEKKESIKVLDNKLNNLNKLGNLKNKNKENNIIEIEEIGLDGKSENKIIKENTSNFTDTQIENNLINFDKDLLVKTLKQTKGGGFVSMGILQSNISISGNILNINSKNDFQKNNLIKKEDIIKTALKTIGYDYKLNII